MLLTNLSPCPPPPAPHQLIINYKLKSTAHIPKKTMAYKFLGTIIDDLASFAIKQPLLHRIACFRDDVVFIVLLYQM